MISVPTFDFISLMLAESRSYLQLADLEKLVEEGGDLSHIPVQPLYVSLHASSLDQVVKILPKLDREQRRVLLDLDLRTNGLGSLQQVVDMFNTLTTPPAPEPAPKQEPKKSAKPKKNSQPAEPGA